MITSLPHILLMTKDSHLYTNLTRRLGDLYAVDGCDDSIGAAAYFAASPPWGFIADLRHVDGGGHAPARFIEELLEGFADVETLVLIDEQAPEPIQRLVACGPTLQLLKFVDAEQLADFFAQKREASRPLPPSRPAPAASAPTELSRQFQTSTPAMRRMLDELQIAAEHDVTVMLIGETGSGKTYLSKLIHQVSPRRDEPLLTVACGALPNDLIESELFGHVKGAFTSAHADKQGKFLAAGRGTILLDEIDVLGPEQQVKLLRVIESGEYEPVGSNQTFRSQARIIVASNLELQPLVEQGRFRPDLYYRLNMLKFDILPLRRRSSDVVSLADRFIEQFCEKHRVTIDSVEEQLYQTLLAYPWPGNVRELEHVIQRAVIYCRDGHLRRDHLPMHITAGIAGPSNDPTGTAQAPTANGRLVPMSPPTAETLQRQVASTEQEIIENALLRNSHSRTQTAKDLGISRVTLYNKMKKYGITI